MKLIAHRGNFEGPSKKENDPTHIDNALYLGFDAEIDLRVKDDASLWLGHDYAQYPIDFSWLVDRAHRLWIHCKDINALEFCSSSVLHQYNFFSHDKDPYVVTSKGYIWAYPGYEGRMNTIMVMPELANLDIQALKQKNIYGICSDFLE